MYDGWRRNCKSFSRQPKRRPIPNVLADEPKKTPPEERHRVVLLAVVGEAATTRVPALRPNPALDLDDEPFLGPSEVARPFARRMELVLARRRL
jgi:hypothetical protein